MIINLFLFTTVGLHIVTIKKTYSSKYVQIVIYLFYLHKE